MGGRKPFKKVKLTEDEIDFVMDMVDDTRCEWFELAGYWNDEYTGRRLHFKSDEYDCVWDTDTRHFISLQFGLKNLMEAYEIPQRMVLLRDEQVRIWNRLCEIVKEAFGDNFYASPLTELN